MDVQVEQPFLTGEAAQARYEEMIMHLVTGHAVSSKCMHGGESVLFFEADKAYGPGHIYSEAGVREFRISNCCEYHFDEMFQAEEEE